MLLPFILTQTLLNCDFDILSDIFSSPVCVLVVV